MYMVSPAHIDDDWRSFLNPLFSVGTALCAATSRCGCDPGYTGFDDVTCVVRGLGSACTTDAECGRSLSVCLQGACACQPGVLQDNSTCGEYTITI